MTLAPVAHKVTMQKSSEKRHNSAIKDVTDEKKCQLIFHAHDMYKVSTIQVSVPHKFHDYSS